MIDKKSDIRRKKKGSFGYIEYMKKASLIRTLLMYLSSAAVFALGYFSFGKRENLFTILAVLIVLPASKSLVNAIMFLRFSSGRATIYEAAREAGALDDCFFDSVLTMERGGSFPVDCFFCDGKTLTGMFTGKGDGEKIKSHLESMLANNGIKNVKVALLSDEKRFISLFGREVRDEEAREAVFDLLAAISL